MAGALQIPISGRIDDYRQPGSHGSDRTLHAGGTGVMPGSYPAGYGSVPTQMSAHGVDLGSHPSIPGSFRPPTADYSQGPLLPSAQAYSPPGSYQAGSYPISSQKGDAMGSYPKGSLGSSSRMQVPRYGSDSTMAAGIAPGTTHGLHENVMSSYPAPGTVHGLHSSYPAGSLPGTAHGGVAPGTIHGLHDDRRSPYGSASSVPGMHAAPPPLPPPGSVGSIRPGSGGYGLPLSSDGGLSHAGTSYGLHPAYPDAHFMGGQPGSSGTVHDLHPGYRSGAGYSPPASQLMQSHLQPPGWGQNHPGQVVGKLKVRILIAHDLRNTDLGVVPGEPSDPFCVIRLGNQEHTTEVVRAFPVENNKLRPVFNSPQFEFFVPNEDDMLQIEIFNANQFYAHDTLGKLTLHLHNVVACPGEVQTRTDDLKDSGGGKLEYELFYVPPERMMMNAGLPQTGQAAPFVDLKVQHKPPQHMVPLPDFHGFGPAAFEAPPVEIEKAPMGELRKKQEYDSWACHLGQYDYDGKEPIYFPVQEPVDRHAWNNDPFYHALEDCDRGAAESGATNSKDPFGKWLTKDVRGRADQAGKCSRCGSVLMSDANFCRKCGSERHKGNHKMLLDRKSAEAGLWSKDPFFDWLLPEGHDHPEGMISEKVQEARRDRKMLALPSFKDDVKRFGDNREYVGLHEVAKNTRPRHDQQRYEAIGANHAEVLWKNDAFFGWLPDHGKNPGMIADGNDHTMHRPLENARLHRLPSFSEDKFLGLQGKGIGVLKIWVKCARNLRYDTSSKLVGRPSACVKLSCHGEKDHRQHSSRGGSHPKIMAAEKLTPTIEHETNPVWSTGAFQFEVESQSDMLVLKVIDLLGQDAQSNIFLGQVKLRVSDLLHKIAPGASIGSFPGALKADMEERLQGQEERRERGDDSGKISFTVSFVPYGHQEMQSLSSPDHGRYRHPDTDKSLHDSRVHSVGSHHGGESYNSHHGGSHRGGGHHGGSHHGGSHHGGGGSSQMQIMVSKIKVLGLPSGSGGMLGQFSKPSIYVKAKLNTQPSNRAQRTETSTKEDPEWKDVRWKGFNVEPQDEFLEISVYSDKWLQDDGVIGSLRIQVHEFIDKVEPGMPQAIREPLTDVNHQQTEAKLEVTLTWSPQ